MGDLDDDGLRMDHTPRVVENFPSKEAAALDYMNLTDRLKHYGLREKKVRGDGNCQFRALSDQLFGTPDRYVEVRRMAIGQLKQSPDDYSPYVPEAFDAYVSTMAKDGEWGDHVTLQAAADVYGRRKWTRATLLRDKGNQNRWIIMVVPVALGSPYTWHNIMTRGTTF